LIEFPKIDIFILCLPFKRLTKDIIIDLESKYNILSNSNFLKVDMGKLIHADENHTDYYFNQNHFFFGGVYLTIAGDLFLSTVKLEGDKPLDSDIYKDYFKERIKNNECRLEKCILKCKTEVKEDDKTTKATASIHIDKFGNYKIYVHTKGKNLITIPAIFEFLASLDCLIETPNNPVYHIKNEE